MTRISRYILKAHIGPFLFAFVIITFILVMDIIFEIVNLIIGKNLGFFIVLEIFALNLAWIVAVSIPMAVLVATLMAYGRLSADNEITGLKSGGISFYRMIAPAMAAGILLGAGHLYFMDKILPEANHRARSLMNDVHRARPTLGFREGIFMDDIPGYSILIDRINPRGNDISSVTIYETMTAGTPRILTARSGELDVSPDGGIITIMLYDGELHQRDEDTPGRYFKEVFDRLRITLRSTPGGVSRTEAGARSDRELNIAMMYRKVAQWQRDINAAEKKLAELQKITMDEEPARHEADILREQQILSARFQQKNSYLVEIQKKYAIPASCLIFVLIGAPLGIRIRKSGLGLSIGVSLGFFLLYWACLIGGEALADRNLIEPALAMWAANIIIGIPGIILVLGTARERIW
jgi:lipopolysaccharide export system permease protein